jgi:predicted AAA+ superfamily ATPase
MGSTQGRAPADYRDPEAFFNRTYLTQGLQDLLGVVEKRVTGKGGDPVIQLQTPFGGGKTHALIALYHKAKEWKAKRVVIVGTALQPGETIWEKSKDS